MHRSMRTGFFLVLSLPALAWGQRTLPVPGGVTPLPSPGPRFITGPVVPPPGAFDSTATVPVNAVSTNGSPTNVGIESARQGRDGFERGPLTPTFGIGGGREPRITKPADESFLIPKGTMSLFGNPKPAEAAGPASPDSSGNGKSGGQEKNNSGGKSRAPAEPPHSPPPLATGMPERPRPPALQSRGNFGPEGPTDTRVRNSGLGVPACFSESRESVECK